jgi:hypothetical protein
MKFSRNKLFALFAMISMVIGSSGLMAIDNVNAAVFTRDTHAYISVEPSVLGVGQEATVVLFCHPSPSGPTFYNRLPEIGQPYPGYVNVTVTFTRPDGSKDTFMPTTAILDVPGMAGSLGDIFFYFKPTQVGTWSVTANFPGQTFTQPPLNDTAYYKPATSKPFTFTVTEEKQTGGLLDGSPYSPLPTGYWERPINTDNREWYAIGGNWLRNQYDAVGTAYNPYSTAPQSAHIVWKTLLSNAGIAGGDWGSTSYPGGGGGPNVIMNGILYLSAASGGTFSAFDLRTGEKLYTATGTITNGQNMKINPTNIGGYDFEASKQLTPILWNLGTGGSWVRYDPITGAVVQTITNVPKTVTPIALAGTTANPTEDIVISCIEGSSEFFIVQRRNWNTTIPYRWAEMYLIKWDFNKVYNNDWRTGLVWNVSMRQPDGRAPSDNARGIAMIPWALNNVIIQYGIMEDFYAAYDMTTGARLYVKNLPTAIVGGMLRAPSSDENGIVGVQNTVTSRFEAYDVKTGNLLWTSDTPFEDPWGDQYPTSVRTGDKYYVYSTDGYVRGVDLKTGKQIWQTSIGRTNETIYGTWPAFNVQSGSPSTGYPAAGADKTYFTSTGISWGVQPYTRFHRLRAYDMDTGDLRWSIAGIYSFSGIADGYMATCNSMDGTEYIFGKGKTETAVSIQDDVIARGSSVLIKGSVMDMSPAQSNTPAVADESMTEWMEYLHMQNATLINTPPTPKGVSVLLYAIDPNGNYAEIGTVTSDSTGLFKKGWTPAIEGEYTIYATFMGSESYWTSSGTTALLVNAVAPTSTPTQTATNVDNSMLLYGILVAVIVAIIIGLIAVFLVLRKH